MANADKTLDCKGLTCPMPIAKLAKATKELNAGQVLEMMATDPGSRPDVTAWCDRTGNELIETKEEDGIFTFYIRKK